MRERKYYYFGGIFSSVAQFLFLHEAQKMSLKMKNTFLLSIIGQVVMLCTTTRSTDLEGKHLFISF